MQGNNSLGNGRKLDEKLEAELLKKSAFRKNIISVCEKTFVNRKKELESKPSDPEEAEIWQQHQTKKLYGTIKFVVEFYNLKLVSSGVLLDSILEDLLNLSKPRDTNINPSEIEGSCFILQCCGKNLEIEENTRNAKAKKCGISKFNCVFAKLKLLLGILNQKSNIRHLIRDIIDKREKGWPENNCRAESAKTLKEVHEEEEKQKAIVESENTKGYDSYGHGYESQPQPSVVYVKERESSNIGKENMWKEFKQAVPKINIEELTSKIASHLEQNFEIANIPYETFKDLKSSGVSGKEIVPIIIQSALKSSNVSKIIVSKPTSFANYIYGFATSGIYQPKDIAEGISAYIQASYEIESKDKNNHLKSIMCDLLTSGVISGIIAINLIELFIPPVNGEEQKEAMTTKGRIELGCSILKRLQAENYQERTKEIL